MKGELESGEPVGLNLLQGYAVRVISLRPVSVLGSGKSMLCVVQCGLKKAQTYWPGLVTFMFHHFLDFSIFVHVISIFRSRHAEATLLSKVKRHQHLKQVFV